MADSRPRNQQWEPDDSGKISSKYDENNGHLTPQKTKKMCKRVDKIMMKLRRQMSPVGVTKKERGTFNSLYVGRECMTEVKYIHRSP